MAQLSSKDQAPNKRRRWGLLGRSVHDDDDADVSLKDTGGADAKDTSLFNPQVAAALGYGRNFTATYQWWILVVSLLLAIGSYILWGVYLFNADREMNTAVATLKIKSGWWQVGRNLMVMTAVLYPILVLAAAGVSIWRGVLARKLGGVPSTNAGNGGVPTTTKNAALRRWKRNARVWQGATAVSNGLLWFMLLFLTVSIAGLAAWAYTSYTIAGAGQLATDMARPTWAALANIMEQAQGLTDNFVNILGGLPAIGRRRVLAEVDRIVALPTGTPTKRSGVTPGVSDDGQQQVFDAAVAAGVAARRALQQLPPALSAFNGIATGIGNALGMGNRAASGLGGVVNNVSAAVNASGLNNILPPLLPGGQANPIYQAASGLQKSLNQNIFNVTGCPLACIDLRALPYVEDGCICVKDFDARVGGALPHLHKTYPLLIPALIGELLMWIAASWLLLHAAAQWGRTRTEGCLLKQNHAHSQEAAAAAAAVLPVSHAPGQQQQAVVVGV